MNDQLNPASGTQRTARLTILVGEMFDVPGQPPLIVDAAEVSNTISGIFEKVHSRQKQILQEVLSDPYLEAIGAKAN